MKRQLQRALFLPANRIVLSDSVSKGDIYVKKKKEVLCYPTFVHRLLKKKVIVKRKVLTLDSHNEYNFQFSFHKIIEHCQQNGYKIFFYPEIDTLLTQFEIEQFFQTMRDEGLEFIFLRGNSHQNILNTIDTYGINPANSNIVATDFSLLENISDYYYPLNTYMSFFPNNKTKIGFRFHYWNESFPQRQLKIDIFASNSIQSSLASCLRTNFIYASVDFTFLENCIIFLNNSENNELDSFIESNIDWIQKQIESKGCRFIYLPLLNKEKASKALIDEYFSYYYPNYTLKNDYSSDLQISTLTNNQLSSILMNLLNLPELVLPALIRNRRAICNKNQFEYSYYHIDVRRNLKECFDEFISFIEPEGTKSHIRYSEVKNEVDLADENFDIEANKLADDVIKKIETLKSHGMQSLIAEIALRLLNNMDEESLKQLGFSNNKQLTREIEQPTISRLRIEWVSKFDFRILLPDYGNLVVDMPRLPKAVFMLFLNHPEGILFKNLPIYKPELLQIYSRISNLSDTNEIENNIDRIVDPLDNSINVNCSRIKNAFVKLIDDKLAQNYYIKGWRGEPKLIELPRELIEIVDYQP